MGLLRAIDATPRTVWLMIVAEGVMVGVLSWISAALLVSPVSKLVGDGLAGCFRWVEWGSQFCACVAGLSSNCERSTGVRVTAAAWMVISTCAVKDEVNDPL